MPRVTEFPFSRVSKVCADVIVTVFKLRMCNESPEVEDTSEVNELHLCQLQSTADCIFVWSIMTCFCEFYCSKKVTVYLCCPDSIYM